VAIWNVNNCPGSSAGTVTRATSESRVMPAPDRDGSAAVTAPGPASIAACCALAQHERHRSAPAIEVTKTHD